MTTEQLGKASQSAALRARRGCQPAKGSGMMLDGNAGVNREPRRRTSAASKRHDRAQALPNSTPTVPVAHGRADWAQARCGSERDQVSNAAKSRQRMPDDHRKVSCDRRPSGKSRAALAIRSPNPSRILTPATLFTRTPNRIITRSGYADRSTVIRSTATRPSSFFEQGTR